MELKPGPLAPQDRYARWLAWSTRIAFILLVASFVAYLTGAIPAHVPIERLPELWGSPAAKLLENTGVRAGWGWVAFLATGDMLVLAAIALVIASSIVCLAPIIPLFLARGERWMAFLCVLQIAVLALAASGLLSGR